MIEDGGVKVDRSESIRKGIYILPNLFTTGSLSVGSHGITATYGGDSDFNTSASAILTQTVQAQTAQQGVFLPALARVSTGGW